MSCVNDNRFFFVFSYLFDFVRGLTITPILLLLQSVIKKPINGAELKEAIESVMKIEPGRRARGQYGLIIS